MACVEQHAAAPVLWSPDSPPNLSTELDELAELHRSGLAVAPIMLVPQEAQEGFYRYGNLVSQLSRIFQGVDPTDADEDDLEDRSPEAMSLITGSYLLDEVIDQFYESVAWLPESRRVRRAGTEGLQAHGNRASLLAVKRVWAADWSFDSLLRRLASTGSFSLEAEPVLVHAWDEPCSNRSVSEAVARVLGRQAAVFVTDNGSISRLAS